MSIIMSIFSLGKLKHFLVSSPDCSQCSNPQCCPESSQVADMGCPLDGWFVSGLVESLAVYITIVGNLFLVFGKCHNSCTVKTSFVNFEKE